MGSGGKFLSTLKKAAEVAGDVLTTKGDILSRSASALGRLGIGSNGQVLQADSSETLGIKWATPSGSPSTNKGDLSGFSSVVARVPVGSNGNALFADSGEALGVNWRDVVAGDIISGTFADGRIPSLAASKTTSGVFAVGRLGSGTASSSVFLRGDGAWTAVPASETPLWKIIAFG